MKMLSQLVVHVFDLVEAEGHSLRSAVRAEATRAHTAISNLVLGVGVMLIAALLSVSGLWLLAASLMWWLEPQLGKPLAACICGVLVLLLAGGGLLIFKSIVNRRDV
ncbi:hypothetical protein LBMAG48_16490 [Phycisphaerae bacterium]|nr:hypothetical protein LBMAG48_16490 [Phycisphaerae bacterium]